MSTSANWSRLKAMRGRLEVPLAQYRHARLTADRERQALDVARRELADHLLAQQIIQEAASQAQQAAVGGIVLLARRCLRGVFGEGYDFDLRIDRRGRTEVNFVVIKDGAEMDPADSCGGGVLDVISFALRLACLALSSPRKRKFLVLDEPFRMLSVGHHEAVRHLLQSLCQEWDLQILMVTHAPGLACGKVIEVS